MSPMPTDDQSHQARNKLHQRLSRARKKEYLSELEAKIRTYERDGVRATEAVQAAARRVVEENQLLKQLLGEAAGLSADGIEDLLRQRRPNPLVNNIAPHPGTFNSHNQGHPINTTSDRKPAVPRLLQKKAQSSSPNPDTERSHAPIAPRPIYTDYPMPTPPRSVDDSRPYESSNSGSPIPVTPLGASQQSTPCYKPPPTNEPPSCVNNTYADRSDAADTMSCVEAAHIISVMRGGAEHDYERAREELGCGKAAEDCRVKNSIVLALT